MNATADYAKASAAFRNAHIFLVKISESLLASESIEEQRLGQALLRHPEFVKLVGLPAGAGVSFEANFVKAEEFDLKGWPRGREIADAVLARTETRLKLVRAYEQVPASKRSGISKPSDIIESVDLPSSVGMDTSKRSPTTRS